MLTSRSVLGAKISFNIGSSLLQLIVWMIQISALAVLVVAPVIAFRWFSNPYIGVLLNPDHSVSMQELSTLIPSLDQVNEPNSFAQILSIDDQFIGSGLDVSDILSDYSLGDQLQVKLRTPNGEVATVRISLLAFPLFEQIMYFGLPYIFAVVFLFSGIWVFKQQRTNRAYQVYAVFSSATAIVLACVFDYYTTNILIPIFWICTAISLTSLISLGFIFPDDLHILFRFPRLVRAAYIFGVVFVLVALVTNQVDSQFESGQEFWLNVALVFLFIFLFLMLYRSLRSISPVGREQARIIFIGGVLAFGPLVVGLFMTRINSGFELMPYTLVTLVFFPIVTLYAITRYKLPNVDYYVSRGSVYILLSILIVGSYSLLITGASILLNTWLPIETPVIMGLIIFLLALLINPVRAKLQTYIDRLSFHDSLPYQVHLQDFSRTLSEVNTTDAILQRIRVLIDDVLDPSIMHLFTFDTYLDQYIAAPDSFGKPSSELRFSLDNTLVNLLASRNRSPLRLQSGETIPLSILGDRSRLALLSTDLFIPLPGTKQLVGWIALGQRNSGNPYSRNELNFLQSVADQAALAIERTLVVRDLEERIQQMDALARIAQGVNVALNFDDILELVYAQTNRLIPTIDFSIMLRDTNSSVNYYAFCLVYSERIFAKENIPLPKEEGLEQVVISTARALITDDYEHECRINGVVSTLENVYAWIGVPLLSGADIIGVFSIGSRNPEQKYSEGQMQLLQAIADQTAGAIVKASLLEETNKRAHQLAALNEVSQVLGSTLDIDLLLKRLLNSAVDILECEAGTLFLVDDETQDLIFAVTVGPVADNLVGQRLPPGTGLVGQAVEARSPAMANDVFRYIVEADRPDKDPGFQAHSLLVFPMIVKDEVIGVIEVINKKNGLPFNFADQELLQAFAAQAAVAFENARLYTMTDQALAERVEELSVMQRIDRELNASLDVERAMRITLDWALRHSNADAGLIAVIEDSAGARVVAHHGYTANNNFLAGYLPEHLPAVERAIGSGLLQRSNLVEVGRDGIILKGGQSQIIAPIRRETQVIGLVLLEGLQVTLGDDDLQNFLARLSDHAAIAISNAQLYTAVQQANQAKSDFISMVSHELKTPMTSIRGYTDLLSAGAVGSVNDAQANFLHTIHSNVERMQILVSDLADVARIEAGRLRLDYRSESINEIINEVIASTHNQISEKNQELKLHVSDDLPRVWGDRGRLVQVLNNLISNANKYSSEKAKIIVRAEQTENFWDPKGAPQVVHISVEDTGYGISDEDQKKVFQKFFRAEDEDVRNSPGTGLGLNITRHLIEIQGGKVWFESIYAQGTTFHFTIPIAEAI